MSLEINKSADVRLSSAQEIKLTQSSSDLYVGQILKAAVVRGSMNGEVMIHIQDQTLTAKTPYHFSTGDLLEVKVVSTQDEIVLEIQHQIASRSILQSALLETLPKQAPATGLLQTMSQINHLTQIPEPIYQQIKMILNSIPTLSQLPQQLAQAINYSGLFFESFLFEWQKNQSKLKVQNDFKAQCLKLLEGLTVRINTKSNQPTPFTTKMLSQDLLPLPGAIPQPLAKDAPINLLNASSEELLSLLHEQVGQVLARITTNQINHLTHDHKEGFLIMIDLPVRTMEGIDVIPLMIKQNNSFSTPSSQWSISFAVNLTTLGGIQGTIGLSANQLNIKFNAEKATTIETLGQYQKELSQTLHDLGLTLGDWKLQLGLEKNHIDVENLHLLDIRI